MSRMVIRPPAARVHLLPQQGPLEASAPAPEPSLAPPGDLRPPGRDLGRQTFGALASPKAYGGRQAGSVDLRGTPFEYRWQDPVQVNPAHEQPRLIFYSGAQPFSRWGQLRRWTRTFMAASPRFQGRWAYVGFIQRHYAERARLTGNPSAMRASYVYPQFFQGPRTIQLGPGGSRG
jgi:hypothetical protein